jgi:hypothetical protein
MPIEQNPADVPVIYANSVRLNLSFSDVKLLFGENIPANAPSAAGEMVQAGGARSVDRVAIVLSPDIIPVLIDGLTKAVQTYQAQFGPLRKPPQRPAGQTPTVEPTKK